ncbi:DNA adenine methylase [Pseudomonas sp. RTCS2]|uniref:DNA adenine methylase n=1 Tax=Pseudomonas sp. RTCS2 TaxID=3389877 RepID=UPI0039E6D02A
MTITAPVIRYHGGKFRLAPWIIQHFPPHTCYVESFGGAAGVLMQKARAYAEVYNDGEIVNLFRVLQRAETRDALVDLLVMTPYARAEFELAWEETNEPIERARRTIIRAQMGFGSAGATKGNTGFRIDTKRKYGTAQSLWQKYPEQVGTIGERLTGVLIENRAAVEVIDAHDGIDTLHYVDPPYVHSTRVCGASNGRYYKHELSDEDHVDLIECLARAKGMVALSGYSSEIYQDLLKGWTMNTVNARISAGRGGAIRQECLWLNPACMDSLHGTGLRLEFTA